MKYLPAKKAIGVELKLKDFMVAVRLIGRIAKVAEKMDHHPDLCLTRYRRLRIVTYTHTAGEVTLKDFILASRIQALIG